MAKSKQTTNNDVEIKKLLENLHTAVKSMSSTIRDTTSVNRELLKAMALIDAGFAQNKEDADDLIGQVADGLKITDELTKKWAKERKVAKSDLDDVISKFRKLEDLQEDEIENAKTYADLLHDRYDHFDSELDLTKQLLKNHHDILKAVKESKNAAFQLTGAFSVVDDKLAKMVAKKVDISGLFSDLPSSISEIGNLIDKINSDIAGMVSNVSGNMFDVDLNFNPLTGELDSEIKKVLDAVEIEKDARMKGLSEFFDKNRDLQANLARKIASERLGMQIEIDVDTGQIKTLSGVLSKGSEEFKNLVGQLDDFSSKEGVIEGIKNQFSEIVSLIRDSANLTDDQRSHLEQLIAPIGFASKAILNQVQMKQEELSLSALEITKQKQKLQLHAKYLDQLKSSESIVMNIGAGFEQLNAILPAGIGEFLGLSRVSGAMLTSHKKGVEAFAAGIEDGLDYTKAMHKYMAEFKPALSLALNPLTIMVTSVILLFKFTQGLVQKYKDLASEMKVSLGQAKQLLDVQLDTLTSQKNQFATLKDIQEIQTSMIGSSGKMFDQTNKDSKELAINLVEVGKYFGYGNDQAVELHKTFTKLGASDKLSLQLQKNVGLMSEMAGLSPQIVAQDLIDSSEEVATYFAGMPDKAAKAVIEVRRMGLSLKQAGQIAQKMLNLEGFMTDMYELQAMTGGGIDFTNAFDKGLVGDIEGMTKDIMNEIGSTAELNKMDFLTRKKIANTLGMSVDDLAKSVNLHEKMNGLDSEQQKYLQANLDRMGDISALSQDDIRARMQQLQSTDRLGVAWDKIKGVLVKSLIPLAEAFADGIDVISPILDIVIIGLKGIGALLKGIGPLVKLILIPFKATSEILSTVMGKVDEFGDSVSGTGKYLSEVLKILIGVGEVIGAVFVAKKFGLLSGGISEFASKIPIIGKLFGSADKSAKDTAASSAAAVSEMSANVQTSISSMTSSISSAMNDVATTIKETFSGISASAKTTGDNAVQVSAQVKGSLQKDTSTVSSAAAKMNKEVAKSVQQTTAEVTKSTTKMAAEVQSTVAKTQAVAKKGSKFSFMSADTAKSTFGTIGEVASKTFAIMAIRSATSFFSMRKEGEEQTSVMTDHMGGMMDMAFAGAGSLLTGYLSEGIEKVFSKKIEKSIEGKLENPIKKLSKAFTGVGKSASDSFEGVEKKGKGIFGRLTDTVKKILPGSSVESVKEVTEKVKKTSETIEGSVVKKKNLPSPKEPIERVTKETGSSLGSLKNIFTTVWDGIKTVLTDIVKFVSTSMKELSGAIGETIKNILKGIGEGLGSFNTSALKGAAAMLVLSAALWVTSKAIQNFASVKWEDIGKAGAALGGLAVIALVLGSASAQMIVGAVAIGILGAALIPAAYALNMFNDVDWASLGKAGVALVGLGVLAAAFGSFAPLILIGSVAIAALGASIIPLAIGMEMFNDIEWDSLAKAGAAIVGFGLAAAGFGLVAPLIVAGSVAMSAASVGLMIFSGSLLALNLAMKGLDPKPLSTTANELLKLTSISVSQLFALSGGLVAVSGAMAAFSAVQTAGGIGKAISSFFGGDIVKDLEKLANLADPLYIVKESISGLNDALFALSQTLSNLETGQLENLSKTIKTTLDSEVIEKIRPLQQVSAGVPRDSTNVRISPVQTPVAQPLRPRREAVAQDKMIDVKTAIQSEVNARKEINQSSDNYNGQDTVPDNAETNLLLKQMIQLLQGILAKDTNTYLDSYQMATTLKKHYNK